MRKGEANIACLQLDLRDQETILWLIHRHQRSRGINDFNRILLALELEPYFKDRARANQRLGGLMKGSSELTEAEKLDVRAEVADAAGVCVATVSKVKRLVSVAHPTILQALREGEVSIHLAHTWIQKPESQCDQFELYQDRRGIRRVIVALQSKHHVPQAHPGEHLEPTRIASALNEMSPEAKALVLVGTIPVSGYVIVLSPLLVKTLERQGELPL
jgi:hypothetical protein